MKRRDTEGSRPDPLALTGRTSRRIERATPKVRIVPPITSLLDDAQSVAGMELARLRAQAEAEKPIDAKALEALAKAMKTNYELDRMIREDARERMSGMTEEQLEALALGKGELSEDEK